MFKRTKDVIRRVGQRLLNKKNAVLAGVTGLMLSGSSAMAQIDLDVTGIDMESYAEAGITKLGSVVAIVVGGVIAFMIVRWGIKWVSTIGHPRG